MTIKAESSNELVNVLENFISLCDLDGKVKLDHICYKCESSESYENIKSQLEISEKFTYTTMISQRRISSIGLRNPVDTKYGIIELLELNDQKPDRSQIEGYDHIEIMPLLPHTCESLSNIAKSKGYNVIETIRPHHTTYDIEIDRYTIRFTSELLVDKIRSEMGN